MVDKKADSLGFKKSNKASLEATYLLISLMIFAIAIVSCKSNILVAIEHF
jgi:hypothetical protein